MIIIDTKILFSILIQIRQCFFYYSKHIPCSRIKLTIKVVIAKLYNGKT